MTKFVFEPGMFIIQLEAFFHNEEDFETTLGLLSNVIPYIGDNLNLMFGPKQ